MILVGTSWFTSWSLSDMLVSSKGWDPTTCEGPLFMPFRVSLQGRPISYGMWRVTTFLFWIKAFQKKKKISLPSVRGSVTHRTTLYFALLEDVKICTLLRCYHWGDDDISAYQQSHTSIILSFEPLLYARSHAQPHGLTKADLGAGPSI